MKSKRKTYTPERGVATIPIVMMFATLIVAVGIGIAALSYSESLIAYGSYDSARALVYADAGAHDALVRIARDKHYSCATANCYSLEFITGGCASGTSCAYISVSTGTGSSTDPKIITAKGVSGSSVRSIQVSVQLDTSQNGQISSTQWSEIAQ